MRLSNPELYGPSSIAYINLRLLALEQRTDDWYLWRVNKASASRASVIVGKNPKWLPQSWEEQRLNDAGLKVKPSKFLQYTYDYGKRLEPYATSLMQKKFAFNPLPGGCCELRSDPRFTVSYDILDKSLEMFGEIKCPRSKERSQLYKILVEYGEELNERLLHTRMVLPGYVYWQLVHQAGMLIDEVADGIAVLGVYIPEIELITVQVEYSELWKDWPLLKDRWIAYLNNEPEHIISHPESQELMRKLRGK